MVNQKALSATSTMPNAKIRVVGNKDFNNCVWFFKENHRQL